MTKKLIGRIGSGVLGVAPPGSKHKMSQNYLLRFRPSQGANSSLVYDLSGNGRNATINGSISYNGRTITSTLTPAEAWAATGMTVGSTSGKFALLDPSFLSNYRPDQGDALLLVARVYVPAVPATGSTVTMFGAMGRNASSQNNGLRFALACNDNASPKTILLITYDGAGGSRFSGNSTGQVKDAADNVLAWYIDPSLARCKTYVNDVANYGSNNGAYMRNFLADIATSTAAQSPAFGLGGGQYDLGVGVPNMIIKQFDLVVTKGRGIADPDAAVAKLRALPGMYLTDSDLA